MEKILIIFNDIYTIIMKKLKINYIKFCYFLIDKKFYYKIIYIFMTKKVIDSMLNDILYKFMIDYLDLKPKLNEEFDKNVFELNYKYKKNELTKQCSTKTIFSSDSKIDILDKTINSFKELCILYRKIPTHRLKYKLIKYDVKKDKHNFYYKSPAV